MRKLIIIIIYSALYFNVQAQHSASSNTSQKEAKKEKLKDLATPYYHYSTWSAGLSIKSSIENISPNLVYSKKSQYYTQPKFSYEIELFGERRLDNSWFLMTGLNYHGVSFEYDHQTPVLFSDSFEQSKDGALVNEYNLEINNTFESYNIKAKVEFNLFEDGNDYEDGEELNFRIRAVKSARYLGIPIALKKELGVSGLKISLKAGLEPAMLIHSEVDYNTYHQSGFAVEGDRENYKYRLDEFERVELLSLEFENHRKNLKNYVVSGLLNVGLAHSFKYHTFFLEGEWKRGLTNFSEQNDNYNFLQSFGIRTGFIKRFKESKVLNLARPKVIFNW